MDKSRDKPTIFFIEKISFSLKLFSGQFYGQSFVKTVRGPLSPGANKYRRVYIGDEPDSYDKRGKVRIFIS